jgi:two-component system, chemotaxis family, sensor histidine kinase and response regulator PixL
MDYSSLDDNYSFFLLEAEDLLQSIEQDLLSLRDNRTLATVHNLMRASHTLKGAASSIGLEAMKEIAHVLEDVFKSLYNPDVDIDAELESLLFQSYECLRLCLQEAQKAIPNDLLGLVSSSHSQHPEDILNRVATIISQLQAKLGDFFNQEAAIPTSTELGFDVVQSIFEMGVNQRLDAIANILKISDDADAVATELQTHTEVFLGLAESLNLPGWGAIATATLTALENCPENAIEIAQIALADFQAGQAVVLAGDRTNGGTPSLALQELATISPVELDVEAELKPPIYPSSAEESLETDLETLFSQLQHSSDDSDTAWSFDEPVFDEPIAEHTVETISEHIIDDAIEEIGNAVEDVTEDAIEDTTEETIETLPTSIHQEPLPISPPASSPLHVPPATVRVEVEQLERLNYLSGELLINQNKQVADVEQINSTIRRLSTYLKQHQRTIDALQDWADRFRLRRSEAQWRSPDIWSSPHLLTSQQHVNPVSHTAHSPEPTAATLIPLAFDSLEMDHYSDVDVLLQAASEETARLETVMEQLELLSRQATLSLEKQQRLMTHVRDDLTTARMQPLGDILNRLPRVLRQLTAAHNKPVNLQVSGTNVLVDKTIAEKLYDPLLHLLRNAFDHGIEPATVRTAEGKSAVGQIKIQAYQQGSHILIDVQDDGQGIDFDRIRRRAIELGILTAEQASTASNAHLTDILFESGFTTAVKLSDLSGRGVGLDSVRSQLQSLGGTVTVHSQPHQGTTFSLQIPLTLSITRLMLCETNGITYALITDAIEQILLPKSDDIRSLNNQRILYYKRDQAELTVPLHKLSALLSYSSHLTIAQSIQKQLLTHSTPVSNAFPSASTTLLSQFSEPTESTLTTIRAQASLPVLLLRSTFGFWALEVDRVIGEQELVIRPLGNAISPPKYICGSSILNNRQMALVIDIAVLLSERLRNQVVETDREGDRVSVPGLSTPVASFSQASHQLPALPSSVIDPPASSIPTVLLVDDSVTIRQTLTKLLQQAGYRVLQAADGLEALEQLQHQTEAPLGVICDIEMPRMNGFEFLSRCRQDPNLSKLPILILTSRTSPKHRQISLALGASAYITKPYSDRELLAHVADLLAIPRN